MSAETRRIATLVVSATIALGISLAVGAFRTRTTLAGYVLALAGIALLAALRAVAASRGLSRGSKFEQALSRRESKPPRPPELVRVEREITLGTTSAGHLDRRLLPLLRDAAAARLAAHHNVDLERRPEAARRLLGDEAWELVRPDRPEAEDRSAPGLPLRRIRSVVDALERL